METANVCRVESTQNGRFFGLGLLACKYSTLTTCIKNTRPFPIITKHILCSVNINMLLAVCCDDKSSHAEVLSPINESSQEPLLSTQALKPVLIPNVIV